jgi:hypothetical protein
MDRKLPRCRARFHGYRAGCQGRMISFPAMTAVPNCPACAQNTAIYLADASELSYFSYYRCQCGHFWCVHKEQPSVICHITPLPEKPGATPVE